MMKPSLGRIVHYRGRLGRQTHRAAIVTASVASLDQRGVESGEIEALDSDMHVHLLVFAPGERMGFAEMDVPFSDATGDDVPPGSWYWPARV